LASSPLSVNKFRFIFLAGWTVWTLLQAMVLYDLGFSLKIALIDSIASNLLLGGVCILVSNNLKYYLPQSEKQWHIIALCVGLSGLWLLVTNLTLRNLPWMSAEYFAFLPKSLVIRYGTAFLLITCMAVVSVLWYTMDDQQENEKRKAAAEKLEREAELFKLRQQLQPHFLFNSLNSISALIGSRPEEARHMIQQLSDFLRGTLKKEENEWVSFSDELKYLQLYLDIEKVRFGHRLSTKIEKDEKCDQMKIPPMLLQPIVENAIKFGLYDTTEQITIRISARCDDQQLSVTVQNPFDPETAQPKKGTGFGLSSVQRRLQLLFGRNDLLETRHEDHLFTTAIKIPQ